MVSRYCQFEVESAILVLSPRKKRTMPPQDLYYLSIAEAAQLMRDRQVSSVELTQAYLDRIHALDGVLNSYITVLRERAVEQAQVADQHFASGRVLSPLQGIPIAVKDILYTKGILTTAGSGVLDNFKPDYDATVVEKMEKGGAVLLGKLNLMEFAMGGSMDNVRFGPIHNPWNLDHYPGGSSSGSGAAVAGGLAMGAIGTDTGGSIRGPAHNCGIVGLKPTYGRVSRYGVVPLSWSLDHVGPMTRTVEDCALMLQVIAGHDPMEIASSKVPVDDYTVLLREDVKGLRIGVMDSDVPDLNEEVNQALQVALRTFTEMGASLHDVSLDHEIDARALYTAIVYPEATAYHLQWMQTRIDDYGPNCRNRLEQGVGYLATQYIQSQQARRVLYDDYMRLFESVDVIISPSAANPAPRMDDEQPSDVSGRTTPRGFTNSHNLTGLPALVLPTGFSKAGLPLSLQIIGRPFEEATVLRMAHNYEQAAGWHLQHPNLSV